MELNLNELGNGGSVFNGGEAGRVDNVRVSIEKKEAGDQSRHPDYKLIVTDASGNSINQGFYYPEEGEDPARINQLMSRIVSIAKALIPDDFVFESTAGKSSTQIVDYVMSVIKQHENATPVNIFCTYGSVNNPDKYLKLRYFNFIEKPGVAKTTLVKRNNDQLERVEPTATSGGQSAGDPFGGSSNSQSPAGWPGL